MPGNTGSTGFTTGFKYSAFISYSHQDRKTAEWLHGSLESYRVPRELVGKATPKGHVGRKLDPVFIDRLDLAAGTLSRQILGALQNSEHLIVVCSPNSRKSRFVAHEIDEFIRLGRTDRILALIVDGRPSDPVCDCFAEMLKPIDVLAADVETDGRHLAKLKLLAGLLGVSLNELLRREAMAERRRRRILTTVAGSMSMLAVAAIGLAFVAEANFRLADHRHAESIEIAMRFAKSVAKLADDLQIPTDRARDLLEQSGSVLTQLSRVAGNDELNWRIKAEMSLNQTETSGRLSSPLDREHLAKTAQEAYGKLRVHRPNNPDYAKGYGDASVQVGIALRDQGYLADALKAFHLALAVRSDLLVHNPQSSDPGDEIDRSARRDLSSVHLEMAMLLKRQGRISEALEHFDDALRLREDIVTTALADPAAQLDLTIALVEKADALGLSGDLADRLRILNGVVAKRRDLFQLSNGETKYKRFLAWGLIFQGEALIASGDTGRAVGIHEEARALMREVLMSDRNNQVAQKGLAWAEGHLGDALLAVDRIEDAIAAYTLALDQMDATRKLDETSLPNRRNVAYWLTRRGKALRMKGDLEAARTDLKRALAYLRTDVSADGSNRVMKSELGNTYLELGRLEWQAAALEQAGSWLVQARAAFGAITDEAPGAKVWAQMAAVADHEAHAVAAAAAIDCRAGNATGDCVAGWAGRARSGASKDRVVLQPEL